MSFVNKLAKKFSGKENTTINEDIPNTYLLYLCINYGFMYLRGFLYKIFIRSCGSKLLVGKNTKILLKKKIRLGSNVKIGAHCIINALSVEGIFIGDGARIGNNTIIECSGSLSELGIGIKIGNRSCFGADCFFGAAGGIEVGEDVIAGQNIRFHSQNHIYEDTNRLIRLQGVTNKGIKIGNNCWIGAGAVFLDGVTVGDNCVIGANAVVTKSFPAFSVIGGVPAKILKTRK